MVVLNPLFVILTLPLCDYVLYPLLAKLHVRTLLQKMTIGGFLGAAAVLISAFLELKIQDNFISILWIIPQYFLVALSENFLFVSHLNFAYNEASASMKSVMTASVYVVIAVGNMFVALISGTKLFESQANEFFFFGGLLLISTIIFGFLALRYKPIDCNLSDKNSDK
jgi:proton-dependent oligopeptide transporter, POT family